MHDKHADMVTTARTGDRAALEKLVRVAQTPVHRLALRMLADHTAAEDATQEILIRIMTNLASFRGDSAFLTWVHRIAMNHLLTAKRILARDPELTFDMFEEDLMNGLADETATNAEDHVLLNELRIGCTMAMLLCLDRDHRAAYVLGDVLEFDHVQASAILQIAPATYRKRLSRARAKVIDFTARTCGMASPDAACACPRRLAAAQSANRVGHRTYADAPDWAALRDQAHQTKAALVAGKLQRATGALEAPAALAARVLSLVDPPG